MIRNQQRLYQYLNWTMRINEMAGTEVIFKGRIGRRVLVIDVELHDLSASRLYALCTPNDVVSDHIEKWQLVGLLTANELGDELKIDQHALPRGVRAISPEFDQLRSSTLQSTKRWILRRDGQRKRKWYLQIKCVVAGNVQRGKRKQDTKVLEVSLSEICGAVRSALEDESCCLIPIVTIDSAKKQRRRTMCGFSVDCILLTRVKGESVGVVFRDGDPVMALMDCYDITNKALLCDPSFDVDSLKRFKNHYDKLRILTDSDCERHWNRAISLSPSNSTRIK